MSGRTVHPFGFLTFCIFHLVERGLFPVQWTVKEKYANPRGQKTCQRIVNVYCKAKFPVCKTDANRSQTALFFGVFPCFMKNPYFPKKLPWCLVALHLRTFELSQGDFPRITREFSVNIQFLYGLFAVLPA